MGRFIVINGEITTTTTATMTQQLDFHDFTDDELDAIAEMYDCGYPDNYDYFDDADYIY